MRYMTTDAPDSKHELDVQFLMIIVKIATSFQFKLLSIILEYDVVKPV